MRGLGDPLSHLSPTSLLWQRCTCRAPSSHWSISLQAIGECLPTGEEHTPRGVCPGCSPIPSRCPRHPQPLRCCLLPDQAQDPSPACHRAHLGQCPAHPDTQAHPQVPPHFCECWDFMCTCMVGVYGHKQGCQGACRCQPSPAVPHRGAPPSPSHTS